MPTRLNTWQVPRICAGLGILEHEHEQVAVRRRPSSLREGVLGAGQLGDQRALVGGQVGEAAAGQLGHLVDRLEILVRAPAGPGSSQRLPVGEAQDGRAPTAARARPGCRRSDIPPAEWIAPPRTPIVSTTGTPQAAILLPSQTPPVSRQPIVLAEIGAAALDQLEQLLRASASIGLGGRPKPPWTSDRHVMLGRDRRHGLVEQRLRARLRPRASPGAC